jgi:hypothetical protein
MKKVDTLKIEWRKIVRKSKKWSIQSILNHLTGNHLKTFESEQEENMSLVETILKFLIISNHFDDK